ncbi:hypothetical protein VDQ74_01870 [Xanthomonas campestris pv. campestris]|nr:hypothetical protein [Xanthomonas campestris pv. campestris]
MTIGELTSFAHNVADSLASGTCFMVGVLGVDIHGEAAASTIGHITVDFLQGTSSGSPVSADLRFAIERYSQQLPELARRNGIDHDEIAVMTARFGTDLTAGAHFLVTVQTVDGRRSVDQYVGFPGRRYGKPRRAGAPPNNSFKPNPLRGSA